MWIVEGLVTAMSFLDFSVIETSHTSEKLPPTPTNIR